MTAEQISELARQILAGMVWAQWPVYLLITAIGGVLIYFNNHLKSYSSKVGEIKAITGQFEALTKQLKANTETVETVKAEIAHGDWTAREWKTLRRLKLEELLRAMIEQKNWDEIFINEKIFESQMKAGPSPLYNIELIGLLYFPELQNEISAYCQVNQELKLLTFDYSNRMAIESNNVQTATLLKDIPGHTIAIKAKTSLVEEYLKLQLEVFKRQHDAYIDIQDRCKDLLMKIVGLKSEPL